MSVTHEIIQPDSKLEIKIFDFEATSFDRYIPPHWHGSIEILFCLEGKLNVWVDTKQQLFTLQKHDIILLNSNITHSSQSPCSNHILVIQIPLHLLLKMTENGYSNEYIFDLNTVLNKNTLDRKLANILGRLYEFCQSEKLSDKLVVKSELYKLFAILLKCYSVEINKKKKIQSSITQEKMTSIIKYIQGKYKEDISLSDIAATFNYSPAYFSKLFKKHIGINFSEYLTSVRLEHAHNLLINSDWTIIEIALSSGFNNARSFYNAFERFYNMSPSEYRKMTK